MSLLNMYWYKNHFNSSFIHRKILILGVLVVLILLVNFLWLSCVTLREKNVVFVIYNRYGSSRMRGVMIASAINQLVQTDIERAWHASAIFDVNLSSELPQDVDACVIVKAHRSMYLTEYNEAINLCKERGAIVYYDVLDNEPMLNYLSSWNITQPLPLGIDVVLTQTLKLARILGLERAAVLYHHHTNPGFQLSESRVKEKVSCIGFLSGSKNNILTLNESKALNTAIRRGSMYTADLLMISQNIDTENQIHNSYVIDSGVGSKHCKIARPAPDDINISSILKIDDSFGQVQFHHDPILEDVSVAVLWPPDHGLVRIRPTIVERPPTRFLFWLSHGVPCIFYNYTSYTEIARNHGYTLPGSAITPVVDSTSDLERLLQVIVESAPIRASLRDRGLKIAERYTVRASAIKLVGVLEHFSHLKKHRRV